MKCSKCNLEFSLRGIKPHERVCSGVDISEVQRLYDSGATLNELQSKYGQYVRKHIQKRTKSDNMKISHSRGRHPGWGHINLKSDRRSYPEQFILDVLSNNKIIDKYTIIEKLPVGKYVLDFAIIELKINIEVDGEQHYRTQVAMDYDSCRNKFMIDRGWLVYRINWKNFYSNPTCGIDELLNFITTSDTQSSRYYDISNVVIKKQHRSRYEYTLDRAKNYEESQQKYISIVKNSNIDFSKYGWVDKVSRLLERPPQKVNEWMLRFMSEFYENKCFKRSTTGSNPV